MSAGVLRNEIHKRQRRTKRELEALDESLYAIAEEQRPLTVRAEYYQAEVRELVPKDQPGYRLVQRQLSRMRKVGVMPYGWITDGVRITHGHTRWDGVHDFAGEAARLYRRDYWSRSPVRVEVWIEKDALAGVLAPVVIEKWGLNLWVSRGFSSITYLEDAAEQAREDGRPVVFLVLGDFDPSGWCAVQKVREELPRRAPGVEVTIEHLAVTPGQVEAWSLPIRPIKMSDSRAKKFAAQFGPISCELDAIKPNDLRRLVSEAIATHVDVAMIERMKRVERAERETLAAMMRGLDLEDDDDDEEEEVR